ncbi:MAG: potassium transporter KtrB [Ruminococcaceae bacterium]|nr:potassium transporter KtrB [Oscillospiraceae bacterium]
MKNKIKFSLSTTQIILLGFLTTILLGSALLSLPISTKSGVSVPYIDALFTATTATCVTGLVTVTTATTWSVFGQFVILLLIQIGGLGVVTVMSGFMIMINKKMTVSDRLLIQDSFNLNSLSGLARFIKKVLIGTFAVEGIGALLYMTVFVPRFGAKGIFISVFNSVSAFCNAGIDIIGETSLCEYAANPIINAVTSALIILGGIGYIVWWDVIRVMKKRSCKDKRLFTHLTLHSKIAIVATLLFILTGAVLIFIFEYNNPLTIGALPLKDKIQVAFFQSVTTRTAGFASVAQENLTNASCVVSIVLMLIGGSPVGTAGGIKTVTVIVLLCSALATVRNKNQAALFNRTISAASISKAVAVVITFAAIVLSSVVALAACSDASLIDIIYESVSATATVGLSRNMTQNLNMYGKIIIAFTMYFGRVGPISLVVALGKRGETQNVISDPIEDISIG